MDWEKLLSNFRLRESTRGADARNDFESDLGRIIFSPAIRRMHDKTQVFPLTADDNIHSRLTHSMEVMAIGHSLGIRICQDEAFVKKIGKPKTFLYREIPIILKNSCLIHDIGNPPFGHFGETVIQNYFESFFEKNPSFDLTDEEKQDFINFDGNAQGFRLVTKLQILNDKYGLNLTVATLGSYLKYPNYGEKVKSKIHKKKRGVFQSEIEYLKKIAEECGLEIAGEIVRHPLCFLMEAADSICYLVMDIEDGFNKGWYDLDFIIKELSSVDGIKEAAENIKNNNIGIGEDITRMVKFRIFLIQYLVDLAAKNFLDNYDLIIKGKYNKELIFHDEKKLAKSLQDFCYNKIFPSREITSLELTGHSVISGLLDIYTDFVFHKEEDYRKRAAGLISDSIIRVSIEENKIVLFSNRLAQLKEKSSIETDSAKKEEILEKCKLIENSLGKLNNLEENLESTKNKEEIKTIKKEISEIENIVYKITNPILDNLNNYYKLRVIVDYISGMTDQFALTQYQKLSGQKII
jgi:dGTPase